MSRGRRRPRGPSLPRGSLVWTVAWRFLRGSRSRLLDGTARAALLATALGVTAMVIAMALMTGYREDLQTKLIRGNAAVVAYPLEGGAGGGSDAARLDRLRRIPGVRAGRPGRLRPGLARQRPAAGRARGGAARRRAGRRPAGGDRGGAGALAARASRAWSWAATWRRGWRSAPATSLRLVVLGFAGGTPALPLPERRAAPHLLDRLRRVRPQLGAARRARGWRRLMGLSRGADLLELDRRRSRRGAAHRRRGGARPRARLRGHRLAAAQPRAVHRPAGAAGGAVRGARADRAGVDLQRRLDPGGAGARAHARHRRAGRDGPGAGPPAPGLPRLRRHPRQPGHAAGRGGGLGGGLGADHLPPDPLRLRRGGDLLHQLRAVPASRAATWARWSASPSRSPCSPAACPPGARARLDPSAALRYE